MADHFWRVIYMTDGINRAHLPWEQLEDLGSLRRSAAGISLALRGWPILPLRTPRSDGWSAVAEEPDACYRFLKTPESGFGLSHASARTSRVRTWCASFTLPGWGLVMGARGCGMWALDVDARNGGEDSLDRLQRDHGVLPDTLVAYSLRGGPRFLFTIPDGCHVPSGTLEGYPGLDVIGERHYLVLVQENTVTGEKTRVDASHPPVPATGWLSKQRVVPGPAPTGPRDRDARSVLVAQHVLAKRCADVAAAPPGSREKSLVETARDVGSWVNVPLDGGGVALTRKDAADAFMLACQRNGLAGDKDTDPAELRAKIERHLSYYEATAQLHERFADTHRQRRAAAQSEHQDEAATGAYEVRAALATNPDLDPILEPDHLLMRMKVLLRTLARDAHDPIFPLASRDVKLICHVSSGKDAKKIITAAVERGYLVEVLPANRMRGLAARYQLATGCLNYGTSPEVAVLTPESTRNVLETIWVENPRFPWDHDAWWGRPNLWRVAVLLSRQDGAPANATTLAGLLGISAGSVRDMLRLLAQAGIAEKVTGGWIAAPWERGELDQLTDVRDEEHGSPLEESTRKVAGSSLRIPWEVVTDRENYRAGADNRREQVREYAAERQRQDDLTYDMYVGWLTERCGVCHQDTVRHGTCTACNSGPVRPVDEWERATQQAG